jgi:purine-binding chemotaxis protein CheW
MTAAAPEAPAAIRACVFALDEALFALEMGAVREVAVFEELTPVPLAPVHLLGLANLRGVVMPVVDARPLLGRPAGSLVRRLRALVVAASVGEAAIVVDDVVGLDALEPLPAAGLAPWQAGRARHAAGEVTLLDATALLAALRPAA